MADSPRNNNPFPLVPAKAATQSGFTFRGNERMNNRRRLIIRLLFAPWHWFPTDQKRRISLRYFTSTTCCWGKVRLF
jgi:hypothetical protein